jgi:hypothetical protein
VLSDGRVRVFELHGIGSARNRGYASTLARALERFGGVTFDKRSIITITYVLFADPPKSELVRQLLSIRYMFRLDHGTLLHFVF